MRTGYFPNRGGCVGSALANALLGFGDGMAAQNLFLNYRRHPLVWPIGGNYIGVTSRILHDLTSGKYEGVLDGFIGGETQEERKAALLGSLGGFNPALPQLELVIAVTEEEIAAGRIHVLKGGDPLSIPYSPSVLFTNTTRKYIVDADNVIQGSVPTTERIDGHAIAHMDGLLVDNGYPLHTRCELDLQVLSKIGVLTVNRTS